MIRKSALIASALLVIGVGAANAQPWHVRGGAAHLANWGADASNLMFDDGTNGDVTGGDGIFTRAFTGATPATNAEYKIADTDWNPETPSFNVGSIVPASGNITFYLKTTPFNDGLIPDTTTSGYSNGVPYHTGIRAAAEASGVRAAGSFQSELSLGADFDAATAPQLTEAAAGTPTDGIYGLTLTGLPAGGYDFKIIFGTSFTPYAVSSRGYEAGGSNITFTSLDTSNNITITFDSNTGRYRVVNAAAVAGPPFYARSTAWGTGFSAAEDLGAAVGGVYKRAYTVATPGNYVVRVFDALGLKAPKTTANADQGVPFTTTTANQKVRVIYQTTAVGDAYFPASEFVVVLDDATGLPLNTYTRIQAVGSFQNNFGGTDFDPVDSGNNFVLNDGGTGGDVTANDGVFSRDFTNLINGPDTAPDTSQFKAVATRTVTPADDNGGWDVQMGGSDDATTLDGNNTALNIAVTSAGLKVAVDVYTGRIAVFQPVSYTAPTRLAAWGVGQAGGTNVEDWTQY